MTTLLTLAKHFACCGLENTVKQQNPFEQELSMVEDPGGYFCMGLSLQKLDKHVPAIGYFEKALKDEPIKGLACLCLAVSYGNTWQI